MEQVNIGEEIDLGKVGYVRLPDGGVVTSGRRYVVRHKGRHVAFGNEEVEYDAIDPDKPVASEDEELDEDEYDEMSYPDLQQLAKARDLNAGGSAEDIRERLREQDAGNED